VSPHAPTSESSDHLFSVRCAMLGFVKG